MTPAPRPAPSRPAPYKPSPYEYRYVYIPHHIHHDEDERLAGIDDVAVCAAIGLGIVLIVIYLQIN